MPCGSPAASAYWMASSRYVQASGSPRRARIVPSRFSGQSRMTGDGPPRVSSSALSAATSSQRPVRSSMLVRSLRRKMP